MRTALFAAALLASTVGLTGCDSANAEAQQIFETTALLGTSDGMTDDDWRVGPAFAGRATVSDQDPTVPGVQGATPNPARRNSTQEVTLLVSSSFESLGRLSLYRRTDAGQLDLFREVNPANGTGPQIYAFGFSASEASLSTTAGTARLVVLDGLGRVVTYGDLVLN